ncbi:glucose-1-phosphate thymidylyltransferase [Sulfolobales archaeon HS-7]|nr:glucose-1-phosphate thymidylyltransferase [Sulfolobales archaeon HS-7]
MKAVILHGGQGTRLRPLTHTGPKQLIKVAGKPVSQWVIEHLRSEGIRDIVVVLGDNNPTRVIEYYGDGSKFDVSITYVYQGKARGLADAVYRVREVVDGRFVVYLGDNLVLHNMSSLINTKAAASVMLAKVPNPQRFGVAVIKGGKIVKLVEKPKEPISDLALVGVYSFTEEIFDVIETLKPSWRNELEITDAIQGLIDRGRDVEYSIVNGWWKDTGTPADIIDANMTLLDRFSARRITGEIVNSKVEGRVEIGSGSKVKNSVIRGPAVISKSCIVENSFIGPYTSIGDNAKVVNAEIQNSVILDEVSISDIAITDSIIGQKSVIERGNNRPVANRIVVGENSWISL